MVGGNFNEILYDHEKSGGNPRAYNLINNFREALNSNFLINIPTAGAKYTWDNKRKAPNQILECLDRFVANQDWFTSYPNFKATNLDFSIRTITRLSSILTLWIGARKIIVKMVSLLTTTGFWKRTIKSSSKISGLLPGRTVTFPTSSITSQKI